MHITWMDVFYAIKSWVLGNKLALSLLFTAGVRVAPTPGQPFCFYQYLYDWAHQYLNIPNLRLTPAKVIEPPSTATTGKESDNTDPTFRS